ncbi:hypothetical protein LCGC14_2669090, partial [marine sediment metagenome]
MAPVDNGTISQIKKEVNLKGIHI